MKLEKYKSNITTIILAGGRGSRLGSFTDDNPKPMIRICGLPLLHHLISSLLFQGLKKFIILSGYRDDKISDYFDNFFNINTELFKNNKVENIRYAINNLDNIDQIKILYTGLKTLTEKRIYQSIQYINTDYLLICYGDGIGNINISNIYNLLLKNRKKLIITGFKPNQKYGVLNIDGNNNLKSISQNGKFGSLINIGYVLIETNFARKHFKDINKYFEDCFLNNKLVTKNSCVYEHYGEWYSVDSIRDQENLENILSENEIKPFYICL